MANYYEHIQGEIARARVQRDRAVALLVFHACDAFARVVAGVFMRATGAGGGDRARTDG